MTGLTEKVVNLLKQNNISQENILDTLSDIYNEIESSTWETFEVTPKIFYSLKDIIWYNVEHLKNGGVDKGLTNLGLMGNVYPNFMHSFNDSEYIPYEKLQDLFDELDEILSIWDNSWRIANIYVNNQIPLNPENESLKIIIHNHNESPSKYINNENSRLNNILYSDGRNMQLNLNSVIYCSLNDKIGEYGQGPIFYGMLIKFKETVKKSIQYKKGVRIEFDE